MKCLALALAVLGCRNQESASHESVASSSQRSPVSDEQLQKLFDPAIYGQTTTTSGLMVSEGSQCPQSHPVVLGQKARPIPVQQNSSSGSGQSSNTTSPEPSSRPDTDWVDTSISMRLCATSEYARQARIEDKNQRIAAVWFLVIGGVAIMGYASWAACQEAGKAMGGFWFCQNRI